MRFPFLKSSKWCNFLFHIPNYIHQDAIGRNIHGQLSSESPLVGHCHPISNSVKTKSHTISKIYIHVCIMSCAISFFFFNSKLKFLFIMRSNVIWVVVLLILSMSLILWNLQLVHSSIDLNQKIPLSSSRYSKYCKN